MALLGAVLLRIALSGEFLRFVLPWMRWPLLAAGVVLLLMAIRPALGLHGTGHRVPTSSWLLLLPTLVVFAVAPPPLGAFLAERREAQVPPRPHDPVVITAGTDDAPLDVGLDEFVWGAAQTEDVMELAGRKVSMDGFVSTDRKGGWYLTDLVIFCCAADAVVERVQVVGATAPPRDQWVRIVATWVDGTGSSPKNPAQVRAKSVVRIATPKHPYR